MHHLAMSLHRARSLALTAIAIVSTALSAHAAEAPATMFVIDGSGSMWGRFEPDQRAKIDIVRELVKAKVEAAAPSAKIGMTSFGHRRRGDCSDVEVIAPVGIDREAILAPLAKLNPKGKGPLVTGLRDAIAALGATRPAALIVIGDGADNCQQDTCAAADEIAKSTPGVAIHMISAGVEPADAPRLACIAKATGGSFADVRDTSGLTAAVDAATTLVMLAPASPGAAPAAASAAPPPGASLRATAALAKGSAPLNAPIAWQIFKKDSSDPVARSDGPDITATLDPGAYEIAAHLGRLSARQAIMIETGKPLSVVVPFDASRIKVNVRATKASEPSASAFVTLVPEQEKDPAPPALIGRSGVLDEIVTPGDYKLTASDGAVTQSSNLSLDAGADKTHDIVLGTGRLEVSAALREDGGAIDDVTFTVAEDDTDSPDGRREVARSRASIADFTLPAGTYYVAARAGASEIRQRIAVGAGDTVKRVLVLALTPLKVSALIAGQGATAGQGVVYKITALDGDRREVARAATPETEVLLAPGRYRASVSLPAQRLTAAQDITLEAGKRADVVLKIDAAEVALKPPASILAVKGDTYWEIADAKGLPVWRTTVAEPKALLAPGKYTVRLEARDTRTEAAFEVRDGEHRQIEVGPR